MKGWDECPRCNGRGGWAGKERKMERGLYLTPWFQCDKKPPVTTEDKPDED